MFAAQLDQHKDSVDSKNVMKGLKPESLQQ